MSANGMREGAYDPLEDAVLAAMVASDHGAEGLRQQEAALAAHPEWTDGWRAQQAAATRATSWDCLEFRHTGVTREQALAWALEGEPAPSVLAWGGVPDDEPTSPTLMPLDDIEGNGRGPT